MFLKKDAKASMAARRTCESCQRGPQESNSTSAGSYRYGVILESLLEGLDHSILVLLLDDARGGGKDTERSLAFLGLAGLAQLEHSTEEFGPLTV